MFVCLDAFVSSQSYEQRELIAQKHEEKLTRRRARNELKRRTHAAKVAVALGPSSDEENIMAIQLCACERCLAQKTKTR